MSWYKSYAEHVEAQNKAQSSSGSGRPSGGKTVTHNGKVFYSGDSSETAYQSFLRRKKYAEDIAPVASRVITRAQNKKKKKEEEEKKKSTVGSSYLTGGSTLTSSPYAAALQSNQKKSDKGNKKSVKDEHNLKWYQKGLYEDGYDFGDVTKTILGIDEGTASLKELTVGSAKRGFYNSRLGEESYKAMMGNANEKEAFQKLLESEEYQFTPGNDFAGAISGAFEQGGQLLRQITNPRTAAFTGSAVGAAIIAGNAGPQALLPEEIISVPAVASAAFKASSAASNFEIEAGHAYNEMIDLGVSEETAKKVALAVGGGNAALDLIQLDELFDAYKVTKASGATKPVSKLILDELKRRGVDVLTETAQEDAQELITVGGVQAASMMDKGEFAYSLDEMGQRLWDTTKSSALTFGMMNAPATAKNTYSIIKDNKNVPVSQTVQDEHPIVEQKAPVDAEIAPEVEEVQPVTEVKPTEPQKRTLYTGSANTDIKQFKVGGVASSKQTGDRYGRGVYLTTNESTAKNYAGDGGRVYQINADDLNIFDLNDTITPEMRDSLIAVFKGGDKQFRNSMLRNFRTEMTFDDFESAEAFFDQQRKVWKEQDGEYTANKPEILEADNETGRAVIEFTDFENWENNIGTLTGNHLYDALKSLSTDDFSSFITGHGFDGIAFDEDADNQQYVIYRNEDRLHINEGAEEQTATDQDVAPAVKEPLTTEEAPTISETETVEEAPATEDFSAPEVAVSKEKTTTDNPELQELYDQRQVLQDTIMSRVEVDEVDETTEMLAKKWGSVDSRIRSLEAQESSFVGETDTATDSSNVEGLVRKFVQQDYGDINESKTFESDGFVVHRDLSADGKRWTYTITSPEGRQAKGTSDVDYIDFWDAVTDKLSHISEGDGVSTSNAVPVDAPIRVNYTDNGDFLEPDNSPGEQKWQTGNKLNPKQPYVLTEQPPVQTKQDTNTKKTDGKATDDTPPKKSDVLNVEHKKLSPLKWLGEYVVDHGFWVERLSKKTGNRELDAKWNFIRYARGGAQHLIGKGSEANGVKSLKSMLDRVDKAGLTGDFYNYMYHWLNFDRMTVDERYPDSQNIGVFGDAFSASDSLKLVQQYEQAHPEFKDWAEDVYTYNRFLRSKLVEAGIISQKTADLWEDRFPHYVPVKRASFTEVEADFGNARKAGFDSSVHEFEGSDKDILPLFDTMAERTLSVYRATAMNGFASELYDTLYPGYSKNHNGSEVPFDFYLDDLDPREELVQSGQLGSLPTLTYYQNGKRHTFDISSEMYESLKPASDWLSYKAPVISDFSNLRRALITEYNPWFVLKNAVKDVQDIVINSQHPLETYANLIAKAPMEMATNGRYYQEYLENGGNQNSYFDKENVTYDTDSSLSAKLKKITGLEAISKANNIVEMLPRFSEYIASREAGRSIEESMLDASRVTTNFAAGGKFTKLLNRNGATFLNASVQGFVQQARNIVEAKQNGLKGMAGLAARYLAAGIPVFVLNNLVWEEDEEYKELPDYITNNYYIVGKYGDGKFVRLPKGRTAAVIQNAVEQVAKMSSGDDEADWNEFYKIFMENIAPNNPGEDNVFAPIKQVMDNKTWYGEDLVPSRLQDLPVTEQYDEKTDSISIWLSEKLQGIPGLKNLELSPKQINYLLDQYSGVVGDTVLPFFTPKAESPNDSFLGKVVSPLRDIFTTDSVLNNRVTGDFYDTLEAAEKQAESKDATQEDKLRSGILISANVEISKLMKEQREIQTSDLPDSEKYQRNRELKEEINALQREALDSLKSVFQDGNYAEAGDKRYNYDSEEDTWWEVKPELANGKPNPYYIQEQLSHDKLGMSYADFWNGKKPPEDFEGKTYYAEYNGKRYNYDTEENGWFEIKPKKSNGEDNWYYQQEQIAHNDLGVSYEDFWNNRDAYNNVIYVASNGVDKGYGTPYYETVKSAIGLEKFTQIAGELADIKTAVDENGNDIPYSKYRKVKEYVYGLDIPDIQKHIIFRAEYPNTKTHAYAIVKYLDQNTDISNESFWKILDELGYKVSSNGNIKW